MLHYITLRYFILFCLFLQSRGGKGKLILFVRTVIFFVQYVIFCGDMVNMCRLFGAGIFVEVLICMQ